MRVAAVNRPEAVPAADVSRRSLLSTAGVVAGAVLLAPSAAVAAYGDNANIFGKITNKSGFVPYAGEGFAVLLPAKWNPSKEKDFAGVVLRYEDNFDAVTNVVISKTKTEKKAVTDYGSLSDFLSQASFIFGKQSFSGETMSEGGFAPNRVTAVSLLTQEEKSDTKGKTYYTYELLSRTADGDEGGRHLLISATVGSDGFLYIAKIQVGDKRWFKGAKKEASGVFDSFIVA